MRAYWGRWLAVAATSMVLSCSSHARPPALNEDVEASTDAGASDSPTPDSIVEGGPGPGTDAGNGDDGTTEASPDASPDSPTEAAVVNVLLDGDPYIGDERPVQAMDSDASPPQSCNPTGPGLTDCGPDGGSCCASAPVAGGTFRRSYDGVTAGHASTAYSAEVQTFKLEQYEVTVGRFRQFVNAVVGGWLPVAGGGKHSHIAMGRGLAAAGPIGSFETGWDSSWNSQLATTGDAWNMNLGTCGQAGTWTATAGGNERLPATCVNWYEAYAFCIWDNGFLPSEAEWNYAASGGDQQRVYPWSVPPSAPAIDCSYANYHGASMGTDYCVMPGTGGPNPVGSESPVGDGRWGQSDLAGNVFEWNLDFFAPYVVPCFNCANVSKTSTRVIRGGGYSNPEASELVSTRNGGDPLSRAANLGARCARSP